MNALQEIPFEKLHPSALNPRREVDAERISALAKSIAADGVLQNLTARPHPEKEGAFEIIAGASRWQAFSQLVEAGTLQAGDTLPVKIKDPCSDRELLELAMIENLQRKDLHPLDEAEGYANLRKLGMKPSDMERLVPQTMRHIQLRLQLADNLTAATKKQFRAGKLSLAQCRVLAALCPDTKRQKTVVSLIGRGDYNYRDPERLKQSLRRESVPLSYAIFDRAAYTGQVIVDSAENDSEDTPHHLRRGKNPVELAGDVEQFWTLQRDAAEAKRTRLAELWASAEILEVQYNHWEPWNGGLEGGCKDRKKAQALVVIYPNGKVKEFKGLWPRGSGGSSTGKKASPKSPEEKAAAKAAAAAKGEDAIPSRAGQVIAKKAKTRALRAALIDAGHVPAMIAVCVGLIHRGEEIAIGFAGGHRNDDSMPSPEVEAVFVKFWPRLGKHVGRFDHVAPGDDGRHFISTDDRGKAAALFRELAEWKPGEIQELFTALVASSLGTRPGHFCELTDSPLIAAMAEALSPDVAAAWTLDEAYLKSLRKEGLVRVGRELGFQPVRPLTSLKTSELIAAILDDQKTDAGKKRAAGYLPPLFHFAATDAQVAKNLKPRLRPITPKAKAKPKAAPAKKKTTKKAAPRKKTTAAKKPAPAKAANGKAA